MNPVILAAHAAYVAADTAWQAELVRLYGKDACNARYDRRGKGQPGDVLNRLCAELERTNAAWLALVLPQAA